MAQAHTHTRLHDIYEYAAYIHTYIFRMNICLLYSFYIYIYSARHAQTHKKQSLSVRGICEKKRSICLHASGCWPDNHIKNKQQIQNWFPKSK